MAESDARRNVLCGRIESNVRQIKRERNVLNNRIRQIERRQSEASRQRRALRDRLQQLNGSSIARAVGRLTPGTLALSVVSGVAIEREKGKVEDQIAALDRQISVFERRLADLRRRRDNKLQDIGDSQEAFKKYRCWELNFSHETLNLN